MRQPLAGLVLLGIAMTAAPVAAEPGGSAAPGDSGTIRATPDEDAQTPDRFEAKVLAINLRDGRILVVTDAGMVTLQARAEEIARLTVGDEIEVLTPRSFPTPTDTKPSPGKPGS
jgi:hypothetical protein